MTFSIGARRVNPLFSQPKFSCTRDQRNPQSASGYRFTLRSLLSLLFKTDIESFNQRTGGPENHSRYITSQGKHSSRETLRREGGYQLYYKCRQAHNAENGHASNNQRSSVTSSWLSNTLLSAWRILHVTAIWENKFRIWLVIRRMTRLSGIGFYFLMSCFTL